MAVELSASVVPQLWLSMSLEVLAKNCVMAPLVWSDPFNNALGAYGDTVNTRKPEKRLVRDWAGQADTGDLANKEKVIERPRAVNNALVLNKLKYVGWMEEERESTLSIQNLRELLVDPAIIPLAETIDLAILDELLTGTDGDGVGIGEVQVANGGVLQFEDIVNLMKAQDDDLCPPADRKLVMSTEHRAEALKQELFVKANESDSNEALRRANLGMLFNYTTYMTQNIPENTNGPQSVAFHQTAIAYATRRMQTPPPGAGTIAVSMSYQGYALRMQLQHNLRGGGLDIIIDALWGSKLMDAKKGRKLVG